MICKCFASYLIRSMYYGGIRGLRARSILLQGVEEVNE